MSANQTYFAAGKLMFFGEYLALCGSKTLSVPLKKGQTLTIEPNDSGLFHWESFVHGKRWFEAEFNQDLSVLKTSDENISNRLQQMLKEIKSIGTDADFSGHFRVDADFNLDWGFGSSSTLISCLSQWSGVDGQEILKRTMGGSGYDVECGVAKNPIVYIKNEPVQNVELSQNITDKLLFVYLGAKQNSQKEVGRFQKEKISEEQIQTINSLVDKAVECDSIEDFENTMNSSEDLLSKILDRPKIKDLFFSDYPFAIKSMGAWGGDFFLVTYRNLEEAKKYFQNLGHETMFQYHEIVRN